MRYPGRTAYADRTMARYYAEASARHQFERPAQDLVSLLNISNAEMILDVGSGTGMVASAVSRSIGPSALVVAVDSSMEMLKQQQAHERVKRIMAVAPNLPFQDQVFDCVLAGFVITHIRDYAAALGEITRILKPAGLLGITAWGSGTPRVSEVWKNTIQRYVNIETVQEEFSRVIPWDEFFSNRDQLAGALETAGFVDVKSATKSYLISLDSHQYVSTKIGSIEGTIVRDSLQEERWKEFLNDLLLILQAEFPDKIEYTRTVHFVSGRRRETI